VVIGAVAALGMADGDPSAPVHALDWLTADPDGSALDRSI
jgi:hypothetical protein